MAAEKEHKPCEEEQEEPKIPVFTVLKNGAILKNIFIVNNTCSSSSSSYSSQLNPKMMANQDQHQEEILIIGRHPDCNVMLTHPSISRFHLKILSNPSLQKLSVIDLSSVHGTWVSERKIEPWERVEINEGDSLRIGGSSRVYRLHWIPIREAYDFETFYVSASDEPIEDEKEVQVFVEAFQDENSVPIENEPVEEKETLMQNSQEEEKEENKETQSLDLVVECMSSLCSESLEITLKKETPSAPLIPESPVYSLFDENEEGSESPMKDIGEENEIHCEYGTFVAESENLSLPKDEVFLDALVSSCDNDDPSLEPSLVTDVMLERWSSEICSGGAEKESFNHLIEYHCDYSIYEERTENQSPFREDGETKESSLLAGKFLVESENEHSDREDPTPKDMRAVQSLSLDEKQEKSPRQQNLLVEFDSAYLDEVSPALDRLDETEDQSVSAKDDHQEDVLLEYCPPCFEESVNSSFPDFAPEIKDAKANQTPQSVFKALTNLEREGNSAVKLDKKPSFRSIWSRRGKPASAVQLRTCRNRIELMLAGADTKDEQDDQDNSENKSTLRENFSCLNEGDQEIFTPDKENLTPNTLIIKSLKKKGKLAGDIQLQTGDEDKSFSMENLSCLSGDEEEIFTPDKENFTPNTFLLKSLKKKGILEEVKISKPSRSSPLKATCSLTIQPEEDSVEEEIFTPDKENFTPNTFLIKSLKKKGILEEVKISKPSRSSRFKATCSLTIQPEEDSVEEEIFTPGKENFAPNTFLIKSLKKKGILEEVKISKPSRSSPLKATCTPTIHPEEDSVASREEENRASRVLQELKPVKRSSTGKKMSLEREVLVNKRRHERFPFQSLEVNPVRKARSEDLRTTSATRSSSSVNFARTVEKNISNQHSSKRSWNMVADITTLLNKESRKKLQLLQGLKGTHLIVPRMIIRELDCLRRRGSLFRRKTEACLALEWIEQCMVEKTSWIHVQSSAEDARLTAPTPPGSPRSPFSQGSVGFSYGTTTSSLSFLRLGSRMEIVSPTTEDHILECALLCRKIMSDKQLVLLSDDIALKVKAMAEGLICERVQEFRESLINPFSDRFLWADSSPRGQTWSVKDDVVLREKYNNRCPLKKSLKGESAKGLKLILLHNSQYGQRTPVG